MTTGLTLRVALHCGGCENAVRSALRRTEGVIRADADRHTDTVRLRFDPERISETEVRERIRAAGFEPQ